MLVDSLCQSLPLIFPPSAPVNIRHQNMIVLMLKVSRKAHELGCIHPPIELSHTLVCEVSPGFCYTEGCSLQSRVNCCREGRKHPILSPTCLFSYLPPPVPGTKPPFPSTVMNNYSLCLSVKKLSPDKCPLCHAGQMGPLL